MTGTILSHSKRLIFSLLILFGFSSTVLLSQTDTVVNKYARVLSRSDYQVVVDDASAFSNGDYVLIIQMQGVAIDASDAATYGRAANQLVGIPGRYEFLIIQTVIPATKTITFSAKINKYDPAGNVQIIKVPFFNSLSTSKLITCKPWDRSTKTGGVLAMIIGNTLTLKQNIDVSGNGFTGGFDTIGLGNCSYPSGINDKYSFPSSFQNAGYKGEGLASHQSFCADPCIPVALPLYLKGQGALFTGGGGGNGKFSGGGGGSNRGQGGLGGNEYFFCSPQASGGNSGVSVTSGGARLDTITGGIFMGGGGGSSTKLSGSISQPGGNGGGIIIIVTDQLNGNGNKIISDGGNVSTSKLDAGAGGGGAGGSVIISSNSLVNIELSVKGGKGGNHLDDFGQGGGGGGGLLWISQNSKPGTVTNALTGGDAGIDTINVTTNASSGDPGLARYNFNVRLNGFLFNSIRSSVTGDQVDSICSNMMPQKITGTIPVGGTAPYTYLWEKSYDEAFTTPIVLANDADPTNYTPTVIETATVWFRRTITDSSVPTVLVDVSKSVKIIVQPFIQNNNIVTDPDTICFNGDPPLMQQLLPDLIVPTTKYLIFNWQDSTDVSTWGSSKATSKDYDPSAGLDSTTWYRRTVTSGRCVDSTAIIKITVLPEITNNAFSQLFDTICFGGNTNLNTNTGPTGGLPTDYRYIWEQSTTGSAGTWAAISGETLPTFDPDASVSLPVGDHYYRRKVFSGEQNACKDSSGAALRKVWPVITNNSILADPTTCSGNPPAPLSGSNPADGAGPGSYSYLWIQSTNGTPWTSAAGINNSPSGSYLPTELIDSAWYRRIVNSSACTDTSLSIVAYKLPTADAGPDTVVCGPKVTLKATPSVGIGTWYYPSTVVATTVNSPSVTVTIDSTFAGSSISHKFYWEEINGQCKNKDTVVITFNKRISSINAGHDTTLYSFDNTIHMVAKPKLTWETALWTVVAGTGDFDNNSDSLTIVRNLSKGINTFLWTITNGTCKREDAVNIDVYELIVPEGFSPNNDGWNNTFTITGLDVPTNQNAELKIINGAGTEVFSTSTLNGGTWKDWDGKNSNGIDLPEGTYYYLLKITSNNVPGQVFKKSGFVILKRY